METKEVLEFCRLADSQMHHSNWCELVTGLWYSCDCFFMDKLHRLEFLREKLVACRKKGR